MPLPDVKSVIRVRRVLCPLQQGSLKLDCDLGDRVGWKLDQHFQQVRPFAVLRWLVVDIT